MTTKSRKKSTRKKARKPSRNGRGSVADRNRKIVEAAEAGKSRAEIAKRFGISPNAVHGVLWRAKRS